MYVHGGKLQHETIEISWRKENCIHVKIVWISNKQIFVVVLRITADNRIMGLRAKQDNGSEEELYANYDEGYTLPCMKILELSSMSNLIRESFSLNLSCFAVHSFFASHSGFSNVVLR